MNDVVDNFKLVFTHLDASNIELIDNLYEKNVTFIDPFNEIRGLGPLRSYFDELYKNVLHCEFQFNEKTYSFLDQFAYKINHGSWQNADRLFSLLCHHFMFPIEQL